MGSSDTDIYGKGIAFPLRINQQGGLQAAQEVRKIRQSIGIILGTQHGERQMRPRFGANLRALLFAPNNPATANLAAHYVEEALTRWEPRITLHEVSVESDHAGNRLLIRVDYEVKATHEAQSLVYPFYLQQP